jgi:hypothetical protein
MIIKRIPAFILVFCLILSAGINVSAEESFVDESFIGESFVSVDETVSDDVVYANDDALADDTDCGYDDAFIDDTDCDYGDILSGEEDFDGENPVDQSFQSDDPAPVIRVSLPVTLPFTLDPYEINERGSVYSDSFHIVNHSDCAVTINVGTLFYTLANRLNDDKDLDLWITHDPSHGIPDIEISDDVQHDVYEYYLDIGESVSFSISGQILTPDVEWFNRDVQIFVLYTFAPASIDGDADEEGDVLINDLVIPEDDSAIIEDTETDDALKQNDGNDEPSLPSGHDEPDDIPDETPQADDETEPVCDEPDEDEDPVYDEPGEEPQPGGEENEPTDDEPEDTSIG